MHDRAVVPSRLVFTAQEAGEVLGLSKASIYSAVKRGDLHGVMVGRRLLIPKAAVERLLEPQPHD